MSLPGKVYPGKIRSTSQAVISEVKSTPSERRISGYASTPEVDRAGDRVLPEAFKSALEIYSQNPIMLYMHSAFTPVGKWDRLEVTPKGLFVSGVIGRGFEPADSAWSMVEQGILKALSIGFRILKGENEDEEDTEGETKSVFNIKDLELYEISLVSIPANREALFTVSSDGKLTEIKMIAETLETIADETLIEELENRGLTEVLERAVIPYRRYPTQSPDVAWNGPAARAALKAWAAKSGDVDFSKFRVAFTFVEDGKGDQVTAYKLPHHTISDGKLVTNLRGSRAVIAALAGARGGVNLPDSARRGVFNHVARHIRADFDEEVPGFSELSALDGDEILKAIDVSNEEVESVLKDWTDTQTEPYSPPEIQIVSQDALCGSCDETAELAIVFLDEDEERTLCIPCLRGFYHDETDDADDISQAVESVQQELEALKEALEASLTARLEGFDGRIKTLEGLQEDLAKTVVTSLAREARRLVRSTGVSVGS
jgi:HK97 family phage prohead protease